MKKRIATALATLLVLGLLALPVYADTPGVTPAEDQGQEAIEQEAIPEVPDASEQEVVPETPEATELETAEPEAVPEVSETTEPEAAPLGDATQEAEPEPQGAQAPELVTGETFSPEGDLLTYEVLSADEKTVAVTGGEAGLTSITIPATVTYNGETYKVTEIASGAFENFSTIRELNFAPNSNLVAIRANAFAYNAKDSTSIPATISTLTFPASLEVVEDGAFHCIPVEHFALEDGSRLAEIPCGFLAADGRDGHPGEETEGEGFFDFLHNLLFESSTYTPEQVAKACDCLQSVDFGDGNSLARICMGAFKNQTHLTSIDFGEDPVAPELVICNGVFVAAGNNGAAASRGEEELGGIDTLVLPANLAKIGEGIPVEELGTPSDSLGDSGSFNYARVRHLVFSDGCPLEVIPEGFFEIYGVGGDGYPGQQAIWSEGDNPVFMGHEFVEDPVQIAANCLETVSFGDDNHLTIIENGAFRNQSHMTAIDFGTSVSAGLTIDEGAFIGVGNNGYLVDQGVDAEPSVGVVNLTLPANLVALNNGAFEYARIIHLTFSDDCMLKSVPDGFLSVSGKGNNGYPGQGQDGKFVKDGVQLAANSLESVSFGNNNSLTSIGSGAFYNQSHLTSIDFGTPNAEADATGLVIRYGAFIGVGNNGYLVDAGVEDELNGGIETLVLPANLRSREEMGSWSSYDYGSHTWVTHTGMVTVSGLCPGAFDFACVKNLVFSDGCQLDSIPSHFLGLSGPGNNGYPGDNGSESFDSAKDKSLIAANSLESVSFGQDNSLTSIGAGAFYNQSHLTSIDFGTPNAEADETGLTIETGAFIGVGNNGYLVDAGVEDELNGGIDSLTFPSNLISIGVGSFDYASVRNLAFSDGCKLEEIPSNFMGICGVGNNGRPGDGATWDSEAGDYVNHHLVKDMAQIAANNLETVSFGQDNNLTTIGYGAFRNQSHVTSIDFGTSDSECLSISSGAFIGVGNNAFLVEGGVDEELCEGIETLTLPANVKDGEVPYVDSSSPIRFNESVDVRYNEGTYYGNAPFTTLGESEYEYVFIDGYGTAEEWAVADLTGKVAICSRDRNHSFYQKANAAVEAGAVATIVYNDDREMMSYMNLTGYNGTNPAVLITKDAGDSIRQSSTPVTDEQGNVLYYTGTLRITPSYRAVVGLGNGAFGYAGIKNLEFEDGFELTELNSGSFQNLDLMEELVLGEDCTLTVLSGGAFSECDELTTVDLRGSDIATIGDALKENPKLECVYFPETLEAITWTNTDNEGVCPFHGCDALDELHFASTDPANVTFDEDCLQFLPDAGIVFLPEGTPDDAVEEYVEKLTAAGLTFGEDNWFITTSKPYTVTFEANGGTGEMRPMTAAADIPFTLPACEFTAPKGKVFDRWDAGAPGATITVTGDVVLTAQWKDEVQLIPIYRMYNTKTSEHLWTKSKKEYESCGTGSYKDWRQENVAWYSPNLKAPATYAQSTQGNYVYVWRLYDKGRTGDHIYLTYGAEMRQYLSNGWVVDKGAGFWTLKKGTTIGDRKTIPIYRAYNPKLKRGKHHYTPSKVEYDKICKNNGWKPEGVKFYVIKK